MMKAIDLGIFRTQLTRSGIAAFLLLWVGYANAHHSTASFDGDTTIELTGTVKEFQWTNPHTWIQINVPDDKGELVEWSVEGGSPGTLSRSGWKATSFKPGDKVTVRVHPMVNGSPGGAFVGATLADGSTLGR